MNFDDLLSWDSLIIALVVLAGIVGLIVALRRILGSDEDEGKAAAKAIAKKKNFILEVVLVYLNVIEGLIPATIVMASGHGLSFWPRLGTHLGISLVGTTFGLGIFFQVEEAVREQEKYKDALANPYIDKKLKKEMKRRISKQWRDVYFSIIGALASPFINLLGIAWGLQELPHLVNPNLWTAMSMTLFLSSMVVLLHIMIVFYISMVSADAFLEPISVPTNPKMPWQNVQDWIRKNIGIDPAHLNTVADRAANPRQFRRNITLLANQGAQINTLLENDYIDIKQAGKLEDDYAKVIDQLKAEIPATV